jgi:serine protease Do
MRSSIRGRCSAAALLLAAGVFSTGLMADTWAARAGAEPSMPTADEQQQTEPTAKRGLLGVKVQSIDEDTAAALGLTDAKGALVTEVMPDGPAASAGMKANDAILALNGNAIADGQELGRLISNEAPGTTVDLKIQRADGEQTLKVKLGAFAAPGKEASASEAATTAGNENGPKLGLKLVNGVGGEGVAIAEVDTNSDAAIKGLTTGDRILQVDGRQVSSADEVVKSVKDLQSKGRKAVLLLVKSGEQTRAVPVRFSVVG